MALNRVFEDGTVQMQYKGWNITPKMKVDNPQELIDGFSQALEVAYQKIRDANLD